MVVKANFVNWYPIVVTSIAFNFKKIIRVVVMCIIIMCNDLSAHESILCIFLLSGKYELYF